jgi:hypothetical protein
MYFLIGNDRINAHTKHIFFTILQGIVHVAYPNINLHVRRWQMGGKGLIVTDDLCVEGTIYYQFAPLCLNAGGSIAVKFCVTFFRYITQFLKISVPSSPRNCYTTLNNDDY